VQRQLVACLEVYGDQCCHCGLRGCTSVEHVVPRSRCGDDSLANTRPAHLRCNQERGVRPMAGYAPDAITHSPLVHGLLAPTSSRQW
jgi:5-methylcytosine-specific restriction endonuclease McrA